MTSNIRSERFAEEVYGPAFRARTRTAGSSSWVVMKIIALTKQAIGFAPLETGLILRMNYPHPPIQTKKALGTKRVKGDRW